MSAKRKQARLAGELGRFVQQYGRKARPGGLDPNDRRYDRKVEKAMRALRPDELSELLSGDGDELLQPEATGHTVEIDEYR
ncbi:hypothetical protein [Paraburkholderia antibiotica]|uniref:Uncharacterized protein n=1 Tax=Paraburkholderia antibiotica TaxID=2728839 RepID=A0A7X9X8N0_9BURK|nr:hypothetical protein [Paraburkholderia antibiotica]NML33064.1 hypothetical protein [Paraburkholderia antibiotica]